MRPRPAPLRQALLLARLRFRHWPPPDLAAATSSTSSSITAITLRRAFTQTHAARSISQPAGPLPPPPPGSSPTGSGARPRLPFLSPPLKGARRFLPSAERRRKLLYELGQGFKYAAYIWITGLAVLAAGFMLHQEQLERRFPTPHEWAFLTRTHARAAMSLRHDDLDQDGGGNFQDWVDVVTHIRDAVLRLELPEYDGRMRLKFKRWAEMRDIGGTPRVAGAGAGVADSGDDNGQGGKEEKEEEDSLGRPKILPPGTKDCSDFPEAWRRGYFEALMLYVEGLEVCEGWVYDGVVTNVVWPPNYVHGQSNPRPTPLPIGWEGEAPREENCRVAFESPAWVYQRILYTKGFTPGQRVRAALAFASWLEYKQLGDFAEDLLDTAISIACEQADEARPRNAPAEPVVMRDEQEKKKKKKKGGVKWMINEAAALPSANILRCLTAYADFHARASDISTALPIYISVLKARRSMPQSEADLATLQKQGLVPLSLPPLSRLEAHYYPVDNGPLDYIGLGPPAYPSPPEDGLLPPVREDPGEVCEEAGLLMHIGEIMYASGAAARKGKSSSPSASSSGSSSSRGTAGQEREEGLAWTREAVDMAEEQLHGLRELGLRRDMRSDHAKATALRASTQKCSDCLAAGLQNWRAMVDRLAEEEAAVAQRRKQEKEGSSSSSSSSSSSALLPASTALGWLGGALWGGQGSEEDLSRWAAEKKVIKERQRRAQKVLEDIQPPSAGLLEMLFHA